MRTGTDEGRKVEATTTWRTRSRARAVGVVAALATAPAVMLFGMPTASATSVAHGYLAVIAGDKFSVRVPECGGRGSLRRRLHSRRVQQRG